MIDRVFIKIKAGNGGNGCISFRREKFIPKGGPDGGHGGDGSSIFLVGDRNVNTLLSFRYQKRFFADDGRHGQGNNSQGKRGANLEIPVPLGTEIRVEKEGILDFLGEVTQHEQRLLIAEGGSGGRGNSTFVSSTNRTPLLAEAGEVREEANVLLELKLLAEVGIIGLPNAGKSSLLAASSNARPKIADYPFTTIEPFLGVVESKGNVFVVVDIPGLIEGAHQGKGLGHDFLKHVQRTRVLVHLVDGSSLDPFEDWLKINEELRLYDERLALRSQVLAVNKTDIPFVSERMEELRRSFAHAGVRPMFISAVTREGIASLWSEVLRVLSQSPQPSPPQETGKAKVYRPMAQRPQAEVRREDGTFVVLLSRAERIAAMADLTDWRVRAQLYKELAKMGVVKALEKAGIKKGDVVRLGGVEMEWP